MTLPIEIEAKLLIPDRKTLDHLRACSRIAGYVLAQALSSTIHDTYLDTPGRTLLAAGYACRRREQDGRAT
jgi:inorganic triphosphatase YgiF